MNIHFDVERDSQSNVVSVTIIKEAPGEDRQKIQLMDEDLDDLLRNLHPSLVIALRSGT